MVFEVKIDITRSNVYLTLKLVYLKFFLNYFFKTSPNTLFNQFIHFLENLFRPKKFFNI